MTDFGGGSLTNSRQWRLILPIGNVVLAACLLTLGYHQQRSAFPEWRVTSAGAAWTPAPEGHLAPGTQLAYAINFPALLAAGPIRSAGRFLATAVFFCVLIIVWYIVGRIFDSGFGGGTNTSILKMSAYAAGLVGALVGIWLTCGAIGVHYVIPPLGGLLWSGTLAAYCVWRMRKSMRSQRTFEL